MAAPAYDEVFGQVRRLSPQDQLRLLEALAALIRRESLTVVGGESEAMGATSEEYDPATDPLSSFIGAFQSGVPDLADRHDDYLAQAYADPHDHE